MNNTRSKVIVAGHACIDITPVFPDKQMKKDTKEQNGSAHAANLLSKVLIPGKLVQMKGVDINPGGAVSNTGLAMKLLGEDVALAVGNAHGDYAFTPKLDFDRIKVISEKTGLPLVLHGGSGLADNDFRTAVKLGVSKVNIFTDIDKAGKAGIEEGLAAGAKTMMGLIPYEIAAMKKVVAEKMELFGSVHKAL